MIRKKYILITGVAGFIGSATAQLFLDNSHSIIVQAHLTRMPTTNLEEYRGF